MSRFAAQTSVSAEKSRAELERTLQRHGADGFMYGREGARAIVGFTMPRGDGAGRPWMVRFELPLPDPRSVEFTKTSGTKRTRNPVDAQRAWEQATRQRWRALLLVVRAKLEAVESGITLFEQEFLAHLVIPGGQTVGTWSAPHLSEAYDSNRPLPKLLGAHS